MQKKEFYFIGVPCLILTVIACGSTLPLTINIDIENPYLKLLWRNMTMVPFLFLMSYFEYIKNGKRAPLMFAHWKPQLLCGIYLLIMQITYQLSGEFTVMAHATIFTNTTPFMLVIMRIALRQNIHGLELGGTALALIGCLLTV